MVRMDYRALGCIWVAQRFDTGFFPGNIVLSKEVVTAD